MGAKTYKVTLDRKMKECGTCDGPQCRIALSPDQDPAQFVDTYLHEILHAIVVESGLYPLLEKRNLEEIVVRQMSTSLVNLFHQNPKVLAYLADNL